MAPGPQERDRIEQDWAAKFTRGGQGKLLIPDDDMSLSLIDQKLGDFAALAEQKATKEQIANAYDVPLSYLTTDTNLANLEAAERQHATIGLRPRIRRRDAALNEQLVPFFDPTRRLYLEAEDPVLASLDFNLRRDDQHVARGVRTINEVRADHGWDPVPWGNEPWLPLTSAPTSFDRRQETTYAPQVGRAKPETNVETNA
jgi:phage portal protein BeeE